MGNRMTVRKNIYQRNSSVNRYKGRTLIIYNNRNRSAWKEGGSERTKRGIISAGGRWGTKNVCWSLLNPFKICKATAKASSKRPKEYEKESAGNAKIWLDSEQKYKSLLVRRWKARVPFGSCLSIFDAKNANMIEQRLFNTKNGNGPLNVCLFVHKARH